jgi:hypothetical protein
MRSIEWRNLPPGMSSAATKPIMSRKGAPLPIFGEGLGRGISALAIAPMAPPPEPHTPPTVARDVRELLLAGVVQIADATAQELAGHAHHEEVIRKFQRHKGC